MSNDFDKLHVVSFLHVETKRVHQQLIKTIHTNKKLTFSKSDKIKQKIRYRFKTLDRNYLDLQSACFYLLLLHFSVLLHRESFLCHNHAGAVLGNLLTRIDLISNKLSYPLKICMMGPSYYVHVIYML